MDRIPLELIQQVFEQVVPFNQWMGVRVTGFGEHELTVRMPFRPEMTGDPFRPAMHGGVVAALLDALGGAVLIPHLTMSDRVSTIDLRVDYVRPTECKELIASAKLIRLGSRVATVTSSAWHEGHAHAPVAICTATYYVRRGAPRPSEG